MINFYSASVFLPVISFLKTNLTSSSNSAETNRKENHHYAPPKNTLYQLIIWDFGDTLNRLREAALAAGAAEIERELACHVNAGMLRCGYSPGMEKTFRRKQFGHYQIH